MRRKLNDMEFDYPIQNRSGFLPCTVIIPTRNRCPESMDRMYHNPLCQCLESILLQKSKPLQVIIAAIRGNDHSEHVLAHYCTIFNNSGIGLDVIWIKEQFGLGPFGQVCKAFDMIRYDTVHLLEDDVFLRPDTLAGGFELMARLCSRDMNIGILALPLYRRSSYPTKYLSFSEICQLNEKLRLTGCYESVFPIELVGHDDGYRRHMNDGYVVHSIDFFRGGSNLISRNALKYCLDLSLATPYGWELCVGLHLKQKGFELIHTPHVNLGSMHSAYGISWGRSTFLGKDWTNEMMQYRGLSLSEIVENAIDGKTDTGLKLFHVYIYYFRVATCYGLILKQYAPQYVSLWIEKLQHHFVNRLNSDLTESRQKIADKNVREAIFLSSLEVLKETEPWLPENEIFEIINSSLSLDDRDRKGKIREIKESLEMKV